MNTPTMPMSLSVIIPTLNAERLLHSCFAALDMHDEIVVADGGSSDATVKIASQFGARLVATPPGRGLQMDAGSRRAAGEWFLFLHADTILPTGWRAEILEFMADPANGERAAVFRFALDDTSSSARRLESMVAWRTRRLGLPYGDQGLLIHRDFYRKLGGFPPWPLMEDVDLVRRIGRNRLSILKSSARTSAARWRRDGWRLRSLRNIFCLALYFLGVPPRVIRRLYG